MAVVRRKVQQEGPREELVCGWSEDSGVYLVWRCEGSVRIERRPAPWVAFFAGMDDEDRVALQRASEVQTLQVTGNVSRVEFRSRWARRRGVELVQQAIADRYPVERPIGPSGRFEYEVLEGDVSPLRRLLSDDRCLSVSAQPRIAYLDIETDSRCSFLQATEGRARMLSWAIRSPWTGDRVEVLEADTDDAERALFTSLFQALDAVDVVLAWNGDNFDFPVIHERQKRLRLKVGGKPIIWPRWCWLDQMQVYKKYNQAHESGEERTSFALDAVGRHLLGRGKQDFDSRRTWEAWVAGDEKREQLRRYNLEDAILQSDIEAKTGFVALHLAVCHVTRCFPDTASLGAAQQGDGYLIALGAERGYRFPTRKYEEGEEEQHQFLGAYVMEPKRLGIFSDVHVCDFAGLYPSIMRSWNMSPDTLIPWRLMKSGVTFPYCRLPERETCFRTDFRGIFPTALDYLLAKRAEYTKRADDAEPGSDEWKRFKLLSSAFKIVPNSFYGIIGSPFTRYYDRTIAEGVTQTGAWLNKHSMRVMERAKLFPFYGDTDSTYATGDRQKFADTVASLNASWPGMLAEMGCEKSYVKLEFEKSFSRLVMVSAKRYAGRFSFYKGKPAPHDMKPEIKGLEFKRGDSLRLARTLQMEAIQLLLGGDAPPGPDALKELVQSWKDRVLKGALDVEDVVASQTLTKSLDSYTDRYTTDACKCGHQFGGRDAGEFQAKECPRCKAPRKVASKPPHVRVARILADRGEAVTAGTRVEYLVVSGEGGEDTLQVVPARDPGALERIDRAYYWESRIFPPTARVLEVVFPDVAWVPTAQQRREEAKEERKAALKDKVDDLPLFGRRS